MYHPPSLTHPYAQSYGWKGVCLVFNFKEKLKKYIHHLYVNYDEMVFSANMSLKPREEILFVSDKKEQTCP